MTGMFDDAQSSPGEWFNCVNVGDDYEDEDDRRDKDDLVIPAYSLVEIVGVRVVNDDYVIHEVRLPYPSSRNLGSPENEFISSNWNYAFTGSVSTPKGDRGRMTFPPCWARYEGTSETVDTKKIYGRYLPDTTTTGNRGPVRSDTIFNQGNLVQLAGDPRGHLKVPNLAEGQFISSGWNALGIYKRRVGDVVKDKKPEENLLAYIAPASQSGSGAVMFMTTETIELGTYDVGAKRVEFLQYVDPAWPTWNQKYLVDWQGVFGWEFEWEMTDGTEVTTALTIKSTAAQVKAALETLSWIGEGNVEVYTASADEGGRWIIEFVGALSGKLVPALYRRRIIRVPSSQPGNLTPGSWAYNNPPPIVSTQLPSFNFKPISGTNYVIFSGVNKSGDWYRYYYGYGGWYGGYGYYGNFYHGPYGYYGGYWGGPYGLFDGLYSGYIDPNYAGYYGYYAANFQGPYYYDASGTYVGVGGTYNKLGFDANGYDVNGYDPYGFDVNGLDADGKQQGFYGRWGHYHTSGTHAHQNDHGVEFFGSQDQQIPAGSMGLAVHVGGSGYVATAVEGRILFIDETVQT